MSVILPQKRLRRCLSTYYVSPLLIGHIWRSELRRSWHFRTYLIRGRRLTIFFIQRAMPRTISQNLLLFAVFAEFTIIQGYNIQPWQVLVFGSTQEQTHNFRWSRLTRHPSLRNYRAIRLLAACVLVILTSFSFFCARNSQAGPGRLFFRCCSGWQHRAPRDASLHSTRPAT